MLQNKMERVDFKFKCEDYMKDVLIQEEEDLK